MSPLRHKVAAAILVRDSRVLLCHRHPDRRWYPNVWDVPGGHVEAGETTAEAVRRELNEELGVLIRLDSSDPFRIMQPSMDLRLHAWVVAEWDGEIENRAPDEHDDVAWFDADELEHIDLADDHLAELLIDALARHGHPSTAESVPDSGTRRHLTVVFAETEHPELVRLRHRWDPVMASGVPPHLTVVYPEEVDDFDLLIERARRVVPRVPAFRVRLGAAMASDAGQQTPTSPSLRSR